LTSNTGLESAAPATNTGLESAAPATGLDQVQVLLVEDDDGDALLVEELLLEVGAAVVVQRARSLTQAKDLVADAACVLLDLGLPDSQGLNGLRQLLQLDPEAAVVVLTGEADEYLGERAVRAGAQDYLVKGEVAGHMLNRVIRYAVERRRAEEAQRELHAAQIHAEENARLERGLLPSPLLADSRLRVSARCLPGGRHMLLGGDFYDVIEAADGWVHALIGDVCGRGPAEAALGVCLRVDRHVLTGSHRHCPCNHTGDSRDQYAVAIPMRSRDSQHQTCRSNYAVVRAQYRRSQPTNASCAVSFFVASRHS